ncbi:guanine nucleotide-binding protein G(i) subunit alpha-like isoform X1 [Lingula anatina]|uniref:Guanine nucleotide-binding protein G(I) subunit alpha-like isoform X1 n=2 Tax=Lingula anatina TaxID=7574 RepID=A0A1S3HVK8_LINAN|nr:guanine nucleotide-binding protein G(i) subunit alpha-like isoform X1 [Lingula anatina]XP_013389582.1 guanine nucleotide-binding protein G(i) subunit alpha-like isoform X1 [Lingula anatina]XP_013389583.1 guanine nucleotide-binding protein G(i) subunit alpha-like isoform X1 [Lingula anatina]|eukprot:XP_013389581.1 guanine nucleotide-binding protein G(i) subunit alpha-like isoform X1 [Lingula anatina]
MGVPVSVQRATKVQRKQNEAIEEYLQRSKLEEAQSVKLLLLGAAESGKSTFAKQMKIIHMNGFTDEDRCFYRAQIVDNLVENMCCILHAMKKLQIPLEHGTREIDANIVLKYAPLIKQDVGCLLPSVADAIKTLWSDAGVQEAFKRASEFHIGDSAQYYFDNVDRISLPGYIPNEQDVLRARVRTTGIIQTVFPLRGFNFKLFDVGGQRSERRKWIHVFDNVTAILFTCALSEYDQVLVEDSAVNRMHESMCLFSSICNYALFQKTPMILLLNKKDIFEKKILTSPLSTCFKNYQGKNTFDEAANYIRKKFEGLARTKKEIYVHYTNATDTSNINFVFDASMAVFIRQNLQDVGMF